MVSSRGTSAIERKGEVVVRWCQGLGYSQGAAQRWRASAARATIERTREKVGSGG